MPITVDAPDGSQVEFPDSMQPEEIEGVLSKQFPNKDKERKSLADEMSKLRFQGFLGEQEQAALGAAENIAKIAAIPATPILKLPRSRDPGVMGGLLNVGADLAEGLSAPAYWMLPGSKPLQALTAGQIAGHIPESTVGAIQALSNPQATTAQKVEAGAAPILEAGTAGLLSGAIRLPGRAAETTIPEPLPKAPVALNPEEREFQLLHENWLPTINPWRQEMLKEQVGRGEGTDTLELNMEDSPGARDVARAKRYYELARKLYSRTGEEVSPSEPAPKLPKEETPPVVPQGETPAEAPAVSEAVQEGAPAPPEEPAITETTVTPQITQAPAPPVHQTVKEAWQAYDEEGTLETPRDLANVIEGLHGEGKVPAYVMRALDRYRKAIEEDFTEYAGRGDVEPHEERFLNAVEKAAAAKQRKGKAVVAAPQEVVPSVAKAAAEVQNVVRTSKWDRDIADSIIRGKLPEAALQWPVVEVVKTTVLKGTGESTSYHPFITIRENGKQVWRGTPNDFESDNPLSKYGDISEVKKSSNRGVYVVKQPISEGPGAASLGDVPAPARVAEASFTPIDRPFGSVSSFSVGLNNVRDAIANIGTTIKGIAGESLPKITKASREVGEAGVRYASSRIAAKPLAQTFAAKVLQGTDVNPIKFGAALVEDNLRSVRESLRQQATEALAKGDPNAANEFTAKADNVATIIGSKKSPFQTEESYLDYLQEPNVKQAVKQHIQMWDEVVDPQFRAAMSIDPDVELPSRGQQTGARVNLRAIQPEDPASNPIRGNVGSNLTGTFKRKSPFGVKARGTGQTYDINYGNLIQNTFERQLEIANKNKFDNMLVQSGLAVIDKPGSQVTIGDRPAVGFPLSRKVLIFPKKAEPGQAISQARNIYVRSDLANEYEGAAGVGSKWRRNWFTQVSNVINRAALSGLTDATVHVSNQLTALLDRPTSGKLLIDSLLSATGRADALVTVARGISKAFQDNREQISQLSEIGAMRPQDIHFGLFGRALQSTDRLTRLLLDDTFKRLVESGLVENTETARREYVNQIGQYNRRLQGKITRLFRDTGIGPFVTAGKTFNALGIRMATLNPGAKGSNAFAAAALRANILSKWVGGAVLLGTLNYLMTSKKGGGLMGRPGTPVGNLDLGTNDKSGKQQSFPLFSVLGLGRGLRVTGASGIINAKRLGLPNADAAESASRDIINAWSAPFAGPPVKFGAIAATGYSPAVDVGRTSRVVPPGSNQRLENTKEAIRQASPVVQSYIKYREGKPMSEVLAGQIPRFTLNPGRTEKMVEKYPRIVSLAQGAAFIDDMIHEARRLPKEERHKFVNEQVLRLPQEQREHARREAIRRKVYTN